LNAVFFTDKRKILAEFKDKIAEIGYNSFPKLFFFKLSRVSQTAKMKEE